MIDTNMVSQFLEKEDLQRPKSAVPHTLDFDKALDEASERAKERIKKNITDDKSVLCEPHKTPGEMDFEWEVARLQESLKKVVVISEVTKATQCPDMPPDKKAVIAHFWKDRTFREQKALFSLEEVWDFFYYEMDKRKLIEKKMMDFERN